MLEGLGRRSWSGPAAGLVVFRHRRLLVRVGVHVLSDVVLLVTAVAVTVSPMIMIFVAVAVIVSSVVVGRTLF